MTNRNAFVKKKKIDSILKGIWYSKKRFVTM